LDFKEHVRRVGVARCVERPEILHIFQVEVPVIGAVADGQDDVQTKVLCLLNDLIDP
jgi:hypothetical protein